MSTASTPAELGTPAPALQLDGPAGEPFDLAADAVGRPALVLFVCNHCPYVKHVAPVLGTLAVRWSQLGLAIVAVNPNARTHPQDAPELMAPFAADSGWPFPYLADDDQAVARRFGAACTPDIFLYDRTHRLAYHGQIDSTRPSGDEPATGSDLNAAVMALLAGTDVSAEQRPSVGCSIKWLTDDEE